MSSTRLPGKVLMNLDGKPMLACILSRLAKLKGVATIVVATSDSSADKIIEKFCNCNSVLCYRASEHNVLERYYLCAKHYNFNHVVRLTADNPFLDIQELERLIGFHLENTSDYTHSFSSLPVGVGAEIFTRASLFKAYSEAKKIHHLEHVNEYFIENPDVFKTMTTQVYGKKNRPDVRLTVDTEEDYKKICFIVEESGTELVGTEQAIELCTQFV
jgi:spore coat polysaccharide biosynthesis protein SpsF